LHSGDCGVHEKTPSRESLGARCRVEKRARI
jgi:hypothetical protein